MRPYARLFVLGVAACGESSSAVGVGSDASVPPDDGAIARDSAAPNGPVDAPVDSRAVPPGDAGVDAFRPPDVPVFTCTGKTGAAGDLTIDLTSGTTPRQSQLHVPAKYDPKVGAMLILNFHGNGATGGLQAAWSRMSASSDTDGYIVAYPEGLKNSFNAGSCCGQAQTDGTDDVRFVRDLLTKLEADYCIHPKLVFSTGLSNGGLLSYRLACEMADVIAAIAPVAGTLSVDPSMCKPVRPVPVLEFHGTSDQFVPYDGGTSPANPGSVFLGVPQTLQIWRQKSGCGDIPQTTFSKGDTACVAWGPCPPKDAVSLCTITGGGHTWPSGTMPAGFGKTTTDIDANAAMAAFFAAHPLP